MLARAKAKIKKGYNLTFLLGDASKVDYPDSYFDLTLISFALHEMPQEIAISALKEAKRVTKQGKNIIIVDYDRPKNRLLGWLALRIGKLYESRYWHHFMEVGIDYYLKKVNLKIAKKENYFLGNFQIVVCIN